MNTDNLVSGCRCKCKYSHSTFVMNSTPEESECIKNEDIRSNTGRKKRPLALDVRSGFFGSLSY